MIQWVIGIGGWVVAIVLAVLGYLERRRQRDTDLLLKTLRYFEGGTQKRNIGIGLVEGIWSKEEKHRPVIIPVLVNQFVYLLLQSNSKEVIHEERNLIRIAQLLMNDPNLKNTNHESYCEMVDAIARKYSDPERGGLRITRPTLKMWAQKLGGEDYLEMEKEWG